MSHAETIKRMSNLIRQSLNSSIGWEGTTADCQCVSCGAPDYEQHDTDCPVKAMELPLRRALDLASEALNPTEKIA